MWELRYARDGHSIPTLMERGSKLPEWYLEEPEMPYGGEFYLRAFDRLSTCRSIGMAEGAIPWDRTLLYAHNLGLNDYTTECFMRIMEAMDIAYLKWQSNNKPKGKGNG